MYLQPTAELATQAEPLDRHAAPSRSRQAAERAPPRNAIAQTSRSLGYRQPATAHRPGLVARLLMMSCPTAPIATQSPQSVVDTSPAPRA